METRGRGDSDVVEAFRRAFAERAHVPLALYGIGAGTLAILHALPEFEIVGLLDESSTGRIVHGLPVLDVEGAAAAGAAGIVVVARQANVPVIYRRIAGAAESAGLPVYDIHGDRLVRHVWREGELPAQVLFEEAEARRAILAADAVSFDVFDTLLVRDVLDPHDVFELVARRTGRDPVTFRRLRVRAERALRDQPPTLPEIYTELGQDTGWAAADLERMLRCEIEVEREVLRPRGAVVDLMRTAVDAGIPVTLISDMYLDGPILKELLDGCGITGYERILVSGAERTSKYGDLYLRYRWLATGDTLVHIGDDIEADGVMASRHGLKPIVVGSPRLMLAHSRFAELDRTDASLHHRVQAGMFAARAFDDPFLFSRTRGRVGITRAEDLGYLVVAPTVERLATWLLRETTGHVDVLLLAARDGWLPMRVLNELLRGRTDGETKGSQPPRLIYLLVSRQSAVLAGLQTADEVERAAAQGFEGTLGQLLRRRFLLHPDEINDEDDTLSVTEAPRRLPRYLPAILTRAQHARDNYRRHLAQHTLDADERLGFFDFASTGTTQVALERLFGRPLKGFYGLRVYSDDEEKCALRITSMGGEVGAYDASAPLARHYLFLESILSSPDPSVRTFDPCGNPVFEVESRPTSSVALMERIHESVLDYCLRLAQILGGETTTGSEPGDLPDLMLTLLDPRSGSIAPELLAGLTLTDDFCNRTYAWTG